MSNVIDTAKVFAIPDEEFYSGNDILFYDPDACSASGTGNTDSQIIQTGTAAKSVEEFVDLYGQMAFDVGKKYGIPYEAILAQGIIESGYGGSALTKQANNFFGIKAGTGWTGATINMQTGEQTAGGANYTVNAAFRKYPTPQEGWDGYGKFITENSRYKPALSHPGDPIAYITAIKAAGYATDVAYVSKVGGLALSIAEYIKKTGKWPPSSEVAKSNTPATGGVTAPPATAGSCVSDTGDGSKGTITATALGLAWPNKGKHNGTTKALARDTYQVAMPKYNNYDNAPEAPWSDCGVFTATVMRASGADPKYAGRGTSIQAPYVQSNTTLYETFPLADTGLLKAGDVLISPAHTFIFTGPYTGDDKVSYNIAQASLYDHPPEAGNVFSGGGKGYIVARLKK